MTNASLVLRCTVLAGLLGLAAWGAVRFLTPADPREEHAAMAERLLGTLARGDHRAFVAQGDGSVRKMSPETFGIFSGQYARRLKGGYTLTPVDEHARGDVLVTRWKLHFHDGGSDSMLTLGLRDGRVATFAIY